MTPVKIDATHAVFVRTRRTGRNLYNAKNISSRMPNATRRPIQYSTLFITSVRSPWATSNRDVPTVMYADTVILSTKSRLPITVIFTSKILPSMIPRSFSISKMLASTVRSDPNRRVENQTKPIALTIPSEEFALNRSLSSLWIGESGDSSWAGSNRSSAATTVFVVFKSGSNTLKKYVAAQTASNTNGTAARMRLNAMPPARKSALSSPLLSQTRFA